MLSLVDTLVGLYRRSGRGPRLAPLCWALCLLLPLPAFAGGGTLQVYTELSRPFQYLQDGRLTGFTVELVREVMRRAGCAGAISAVPWKRGYQEVLDRADAAIFPTYRTPERERLFRWSDPILKGKWVLYKRKGSPLRLSNLDDARRVGRIAVYGADARAQFLRSRNFTNLEELPDNVSRWRMLAGGRVDLAAGTNIASFASHGEYERLLEQAEPALVMAEYTLHVAFSPGADPALIHSWNLALRAMVRDGSYAALYRRFFTDEAFSPYPLTPLTRKDSDTRRSPPFPGRPWR